MTIGLTILTVIYVVGVFITAFASVSGYYIDAPSDYGTEQSRERARERQKGHARRALLSPLWPLLVIKPIRKIWEDAKQPKGRGGGEEHR